MKSNPSIKDLARVMKAGKKFPTAERPPGPKGTLIMGVMRDFNRDSLGFIERAQRDFGDVVWMRFLYVPALFLYHPNEVEYVLATNPKNFLKSMSLRSNFFQRLVGNGLLTSQGEEWKRQRRLSAPAFHRERVATYAGTMVDYTERLMAGWQDREARDVHRDMMRLTLEIVVRCLFSADVSTDVDHVGDTLKELVKPFASQATLTWILNNRLPTPAHLRFHRLAKRIDDIVYRIIGERRASGKDEGDLLSMLLAARDEDGSQMSDQQLRDEVMTLFLAGHETTALTLAWSWYLLGTHPTAEKKFHAELDEVLGGRSPTMADLPRLKYTEQIAKESMRLYPPAYGLGREAIDDCEIGGYRVPAGTQVFMFQWVTQRDPRFFDQPHQFMPERWTPDFIERLPKYAYFPFGGGPRACIGASFAMMEIILVLATIGQKFRLKLVPDHPVEIYPAMSLRPKDGVKVILRNRVSSNVDFEASL
ncbi:MAG: cytochrome P450 [Pyrinomonadaceae bacterium]